MSDAIIRADGSLQLGMGHIMRGLAMAEGLRNAGIESLFVTRAFSSDASRVITSHGFAIEEMPPDATMTEEIAATVEHARHRSAQLLVTDVCHSAALKQRERLDALHLGLKKHCFTLCLAGSTVVDIPANIVVSPYFRREYPELEPEVDRRVLLGPDYFIFRQEFVAASAAPRLIADRARNVLISIGGSDELHLSIKAILAVVSLGDPELDIHVIVGPGYTPELRRDVGEALAPHCGRFEVVKQPVSMASEMLWADLAITGDGLTKYETAVTGTPSIMVSRPDSEHELNAQFQAAGTTEHIGDGELITVETFASAANRLLIDVGWREKMSRNGKRLVDGRGFTRILETIPVEVVG